MVQLLDEWQQLALRATNVRIKEILDSHPLSFRCLCFPNTVTRADGKAIDQPEVAAVWHFQEQLVC